MIWPIYLDAGKSLNEGRKISKEYAVSEPRIKEIVKATQKLRYKKRIRHILANGTINPEESSSPAMTAKRKF